MWILARSNRTCGLGLLVLLLWSVERGIRR